jgi:osmotically-inducible protein OsmY
MFDWSVRTPTGELRGEEKKVYVKARRALWDYEPLRASHAEIQVGVRGSDVILSGRVRTLPQKLLAQLFVSRVPEVTSVANELVADPEVVRSVADALARDKRTAAYIIQVSSAHGIVTLQGPVPDENTKRAALNTASQVSTVSAVRDQMTLGAPKLEAVALV